MEQMKRFAGQVAVVTGGASGIGAGVAKRLVAGQTMLAASLRLTGLLLIPANLLALLAGHACFTLPAGYRAALTGIFCD
jgi:NAD(P)-dependent dehydrogenase (short-subunit alcohol dehydrogenase family)